MYDIPSKLLMELVFEHLDISYEMADIWQDNVDNDVIDMQAVAEVVSENLEDFMDELVVRVEDMSGEGQARSFGMWVDSRDCKSVREMLTKEGVFDAETIEDVLEGYTETEEVYYVAVLYGDIHSVVEDERAGAEVIVREAIDSEEWKTLAGLLVNIED